MIIHVVELGDTINSIADKYQISVERLILDNGLPNPDNLVVGQCIIIAHPVQTYTIQEGDSLQEIAIAFNVSLLQLYQNNPFLSNREYIYPGETIVIRYDNTKGPMTIHGNTFPFINFDTLRKTLPYLTYLSIINYTVTAEGEIISSYNDTDIIQLAKDYGVVPLMLLTTFTLQGEANLRVTYDLLLNEDFQNKQIDNILLILREKGYYGVNLTLQYINTSTLRYYESYLSKVYKRLYEEGYDVFVTITPGISIVDSGIYFERVDYSNINRDSTNVIFMNYEWATSLNAPSPITSISNIQAFLEYIHNYIPFDKVIIGMPTIGYDWELPYVAGVSNVNSLSFNNAINLASIVGTVIQFDEESQTPYFVYTINDGRNLIQHVVWFIDARSINSIMNLIKLYNLLGTGIWNIMEYTTQLWLLINSQYEIVKLI